MDEMGEIFIFFIISFLMLSSSLYRGSSNQNLSSDSHFGVFPIILNISRRNIGGELFC